MVVSVSVATSECTIEQSSIALKAKPSGPSSSKRLHKPKAPRTQTVTKYRQADIKRIDGCKDLLSRARKELWREVVLGEVTLFPEQDERSQCLDRCVSRAEQVVGPVFHNSACKQYRLLNFISITHRSTIGEVAHHQNDRPRIREFVIER